MRNMIAVGAIGIALTGTTQAKDTDIDISDYPEMSQERALPQIASALHDTLYDVSSVTNFKICYPPAKMKFKDGKPVRWTIMLSLNSKNQYGGHAGNQGMAAVFYSDKPVWVFSIDMPLDRKTLATCTRIPDAEIQKLLQGE